MGKIFIPEKEVAERLNSNYRIEDDIITNIDIQIIPHFGFLPSLSILCSNRYIIPTYNNTRNLGYILHQFMQLFDLRDDGTYLSEFTDQPVRLVYDSKEPFEGSCVAIGHTNEDKFIFIDDMMKADRVVFD